MALAQVDATRVVGLELAETAAAAARAYLAGALAPELQARVEMVQGDFFAFQYPDGPADLGYDYTFCCALHPTMLEHWAQTWARHIRPGGRLVALIFPVDPTRTTGPPWAVTTDQYKALLEPQGEARGEAVCPAHAPLAPPTTSRPPTHPSPSHPLPQALCWRAWTRCPRR